MSDHIYEPLPLPVWPDLAVMQSRRGEHAKSRPHCPFLDPPSLHSAREARIVITFAENNDHSPARNCCRFSARAGCVPGKCDWLVPFNSYTRRHKVEMSQSGHTGVWFSPWLSGQDFQPYCCQSILIKILETLHFYETSDITNVTFPPQKMDANHT